jgi:hypothetical protein
LDQIKRIIVRKTVSVRCPHLTAVTMMLSLGAASVYAQQRPVTGSFSGTAVPSTVNLQAGTNAGDYDFGGNSALGPFTFRAFTASAPSQAPIGTTCSLYGSVVAGGGVFRFQDGSLLMVDSAKGTDCIQFTPTGPVAYCTRTFNISRGTDRFKNASGGTTVTFTFTVLPVLFASGAPVLSGITDGELTGTLSVR